MRKAIILQALLLTLLLAVAVTPAYAQSADVSKIESFIKNIIQVLVTLSGLVAVGFFVWGGFRYITSSGNPEALDSAKKTLLYSAIGLTVVLGAYMLSNLVSQLATAAFGGGK